MKHTRSRPFPWIALPLAASLLLCAACREEAPPRKPVAPVRIHRVAPIAQDAPTRYSATLRPRTQVELLFRVGGYVEEVLQVRDKGEAPRPIQEGDRVKKGTVLARLRDAEFQAKVRQARAQRRELEAVRRQAEAQLLEATAQKDLATRDEERASHLYATRSLVKPDYDTARAKALAARAGEEAARAACEAARARLEGAAALVLEAETALKDTSLKAPMDGIVLKRAVEPGSLTGPGSLAFLIADTSVMKVAMGIPDIHLSEIRPGESLGVRVQAMPSRDFQGSVSRILPAADPASRIFEVELSLPNSGDLLKVGMIASVSIPRGTEPVRVLAIPLSSVVRDRTRPQGYAVMLVAEEGGRQVARSRSVELGEASGNLLEVTRGLQEGDIVIASGGRMLTDGEEVRVIP